MTDQPDHATDMHLLALKEALSELIELLEDYAPTWYTEEQHKRAVAALKNTNTASYAVAANRRSRHA